MAGVRQTTGIDAVVERRREGLIEHDATEGHVARGDTLGRPMPDIACHKNARHTGFKIERIAIRRPSGRAPPFAHQMLAGDEVALLVPLDHFRERLPNCRRGRG